MHKNNSIAIFGGSFNPPLNSHLMLVREILKNEKLNIDKIIFVPVSTNYNKSELASNEDRYNMLKLICDEEQKIDVSRVELDSDKQLYTIETLNFLQNEHENSNLYFVLGTDNLKEFATWKSPEEILKKYKLIVLDRGIDKAEKIIAEDELLKKNRDSIIVVGNIRISLSSTTIRKLIKEEKEISEYLPEKVLKYIEENNLYKDL